MARLDVKVRLSGGIVPAELVSMGKKTSWVKLQDKHVIKVRNNKLTWETKDVHTGSILLDSAGNPVGANS